jgi:hypothetical protein
MKLRFEAIQVLQINKKDNCQFNAGDYAFSYHIDFGTTEDPTQRSCIARMSLLNGNQETIANMILIAAFSCDDQELETKSADDLFTKNELQFMADQTLAMARGIFYERYGDTFPNMFLYPVMDVSKGGSETEE